MPNGGTDNCMNCRHNRANQTSTNVKTALPSTRLPFCSVHKIPIWDRAWTYCANITRAEPDIHVPISTRGLYSGGYVRIPWLGRLAPKPRQGINQCEICGDSASKGLIINLKKPNLQVEFCSNEHYMRWHKHTLDSRGFDSVYPIAETELHESIRQGERKAIDNYDPATESIDEPDAMGWTALHLAAYFGQAEFVALLIGHGASARKPDRTSQLPIDLAGREGHAEVVKYLMAATFHSNEEHDQALLKAANGGNLELVVALINGGANIEYTDYRGRTPLLLAVWEGHYTMSVFLLDHGANVRIEDDYGVTPLKTVETWKTQISAELRQLIHEWLDKSDGY